MVVRNTEFSVFLILSVLSTYTFRMLAGQRLESDPKAGKKNSFSGLPIRLCFDGHADMIMIPSGSYFKLHRRKLAKSAEHRGLVRGSSRTVLIKSSIRSSIVLDTTIESNQAITVLTLQVLEYLG